MSDVPGLDVQLFFMRVLFNFIIGNGDAHAKNFSMIYDDNGNARLSKAYDIVSSKLVIPDESDTALSLNGKKDKITGKDFIEFADYLDIPRKVIENKFLDKEDYIKEMIKNSTLENEEKHKLIEIVTERFIRLKITKESQ